MSPTARFDVKPDWQKMRGLLPVVAQDAATGEVLTVAYMNEEALDLTRRTGLVHYWSRSRERIWKKGEESGNVQEVVALALDCDMDTLLATVRPHGPACHTGERTCFHHRLHGDPAIPLVHLERTFAARMAAPVAGSHTSRLMTDENLRLKKVAEEAGEVIMAAKDKDPKRLASEIADLVYHALAAGAAAGVTPGDVLRELERRRK